MSEESASQVAAPETTTSKSSVKANKECRHFTRNGYCHFGNKCKFLHIMPEAKTTVSGKVHEFTAHAAVSSGEINIALNDPDSVSVNDPGEEASKVRSEFEPVSSKNVANVKSFNNKDKFAATAKSKVVCKYFSLKGWCRFGAYCRYSHVLPKEGMMAEAEEDKREAVTGAQVTQAPGDTHASNGIEKKAVSNYDEGGSEETTREISNQHSSTRRQVVRPITKKLELLVQVLELIYV